MVNIDVNKYSSIYFNNCDNAETENLILRNDDTDDTIKSCSRCNLTLMEWKKNSDDIYLCLDCVNQYNKIIKSINRCRLEMKPSDDKTKCPWPIIDTAFLLKLFDSAQLYNQLFKTIIKMQHSYGDTYSIIFNNYKLYVDNNDFIFNKI